MFGTLTGFVFKFVVDKFIVFQDKIISHSKDEIQKTTKQLGLYLGFAILTTAIFWGFELVFKILFSGDWYLIGGLVGLIIGYTLKFLFDRKYVFKKK
jgi:putative flippase GtrA